MVFGAQFTECICNLLKKIEYIAHRNPHNGIVNMFINPTKEGLLFANTMGSTGYTAVVENIKTKQIIVCFKPTDFPELYKQVQLVRI